MIDHGGKLACLFLSEMPTHLGTRDTLYGTPETFVSNRWLVADLHFRPETIESLFIAFRLTGDQRYRDWAWSIFQAIEKHCKIETGGYSAILNVDAVPVRHDDKMETFFLVRISIVSWVECFNRCAERNFEISVSDI